MTKRKIIKELKTYDVDASYRTRKAVLKELLNQKKISRTRDHAGSFIFAIVVALIFIASIV